MSALPFDVPHLDAICSLPQGLLYPHQADGVVFLISKGRAILADDTQDETSSSRNCWKRSCASSEQ